MPINTVTTLILLDRVYIHVILGETIPKSPLARIPEILKEWDSRDHRGDRSHTARGGGGHRGGGELEVFGNHHFGNSWLEKMMIVRSWREKRRRYMKKVCLGNQDSGGVSIV